jgi:hypothetical protein
VALRGREPRQRGGITTRPIGSSPLPGSVQPQPDPRIGTVVPLAGIRIRIQLQLFFSTASSKFPFGSAVSLSRYSPAGSPVMSIHCQAKFQG